MEKTIHSGFKSVYHEIEMAVTEEIEISQNGRNAIVIYDKFHLMNLMDALKKAANKLGWEV